MHIVSEYYTTLPDYLLNLVSHDQSNTNNATYVSNVVVCNFESRRDTNTSFQGHLFCCSRLNTLPGMSGRALFFAGSDDDDDDSSPAGHKSQVANAVELSVSGVAPREQRLFLADSDEEQEEEMVSRLQGPPRHSSGLLPPDDGVDDFLSESDLLPLEAIPRAPSVSSLSSGLSGRGSSPVPSESSPPPAKKRRLLPDKVSTHPSSTGDSYLGCLVVGNAWSTVKGKGYISPGDEVLVERDGLADTPRSSKGKNKEAANRGKKKQLTLKAMVNPQPSKFMRRKVDAVIRLTNKAGFGEQAPHG